MIFRAQPLLPRLAAIFVALLACPRGSLAANLEKDVLTTATDLTSGASYLGGGTPGTKWDATFLNVIYSATTFTVNTNLGLGTLNDLDATQALLITNNGANNATLTLNGGGNTVAGSSAADLIFVGANGSLTIQNGAKTLGLALAADGNFDTAAGAMLTIRSVVSGNNFNLAKTGAGTLTLSGTNTFGGAVRTFTLAGGALNINSAAALGNTANTFVINGGTTIANTSGSAITTSNYGLTLNGDFTFAGGATGSARDLNFGTGNITLGTSAGTSRTIAVTAGNSTLTLGGVIANGATANSVIKTGAGILTYSGTTANTYTGMTTVNAGELDLNKTAGIVAIAGGLTVGDGAGGPNSDIVKLLANGQIATTTAVLINGTSGKLDLNGFTQTLGSIADTGTVTSGGSSVNLGAGTLTVGSTTSTIFSGAITGAGGSLIKQGAGTLALGGTNTYSGNTTIRAGTLQLNASNAFPTSGNLTMLGGTLDIRGQSPVVGNITFGDGTVTAATSVTDSAAVKGSLILTGNILYNGTAAHTFPPALLSANIQLAAGTHSVNNPNTQYSSATNYDVVFSGVISGPGGIAKDGPANSFWIAFNAQNTYTGVTNITAGNLYLGVVNSVPSLSAVTISAGASLILNPPATQYGVTAGSYSQNIGSLAGAGTVTLGSATLTTGNDGTSTNFTGVISGTGGFVKVGTGVQTLSGADTFSGGTTIKNGTLVLNSNTAAGTGTITVGDVLVTSTSPASLLLSATAGRTVSNAINVPAGSTGSRTIGGLNTTGVNTFSGTVALGTAVTLTAASGGGVNLTGVISGIGGIVKTGAGSATLTAANTYTGNTTVTGGTLVAGNNLAFGAATQTVTLNGGGLASNSDTRSLANPIIATAAGGQITGSNSMTLTGAVTGGAGSKLDVNLTDNTKTVTANPVAANSFAPGTLSLTSGTLILGGANKIADTTDIKLNGGTLNTGGNSDSLGAMILAADSTIDFGSSNNVRLQFSSATWTGGTLNVVNWTGTPAVANNPDQFLIASGSISMDFLNHISFQGYGSGAVAFDRGGGLHEIVPVPEPATIFSALAIIAFVGFRERRTVKRWIARSPSTAK